MNIKILTIMINNIKLPTRIFQETLYFINRILSTGKAYEIPNKFTAKYLKCIYLLYKLLIPFVLYSAFLYVSFLILMESINEENNILIKYIISPNSWYFVLYKDSPYPSWKNYGQNS